MEGPSHSDNHEPPPLSSSSASKQTEAQPLEGRPVDLIEQKAASPPSGMNMSLEHNEQHTTNQKPERVPLQLVSKHYRLADDERTPAARYDSLKRVCYFHMEPKTEITLSQVDGSLCTHLILAFARINPDAKLVVWHQSDYDYLGQVPEFKRKYPSVKVMLSVFNDCEFNGFPMLAHANNELRYKFAKSVVELLETFQLDGIDLHWEFPNFPSSLFGSRGECERAGLTKILKALRSAIVENFFCRQQCEQQQELSRQSSRSGGGCASGYSSSVTNQAHQVEPHLLTVAIGCQEAILRASYELKQLANLCDWLNVMSYDYFLFKPYLPFTGPSAPLNPIVEHYPILNKLSLSWTVQRLLDEGLDKEKLVLGIPCYARAYRLVFRQTTPPVPFTLALGAKGGRHMEDRLNYREVLELLGKPDSIVEFDERARVPYLLADSGYTWVSYENEQSAREKVRYILDRELGGYMTWNLNSDDFTGGVRKDSVDLLDTPPQETNQANSNSSQNNGYSAKRASQQNEQRSTTTSTEVFPLHRAMLDEALNNRTNVK
uniref:Chitotriosidase-1 n=2 Tax=Aceria tosichella TaxID=561515 RepID=A0A6G1SC14_9ACAR